MTKDETNRVIDWIYEVDITLEDTDEGQKLIRQALDEGLICEVTRGEWVDYVPGPEISPCRRPKLKI